MAFRRSFRRTRKAKPMQWCATTSGWGATSLVTTAGVTNNILLGTYSPGLVGSAVPQLGRLTIMRIRGQIVRFALVPTDEYVECFGIFIADVQSGGTVFASMDPSLSNDADKSWLWLMHARGACGCYHEVDIKVKRIMKPDQVLVLASRNVPSIGVGSAQLSPFIRSLVANVA